MTIRESVKNEIDTLPSEALYAVRDFLLFLKYREILGTDDTTYLNALPGMTDSIKSGIKTPQTHNASLAFMNHAKSCRCE